MKHIRWIVIALFLFCAVPLIWMAWDIYCYSQTLEVVSADVAVVLGAGTFGDQPSPVLRERVHHAIWLYEQGYVDTIIFTGGKGETAVNSEAFIASQYAQAQGIPPESILLEEESTDTQENLYFAKMLMQQYELETALIISTPFHMKRAMSITHDLGLEAYSSPTQTIQWINGFTKSRAFVQEVGSYLLYLLEKIMS